MTANHKLTQQLELWIVILLLSSCAINDIPTNTPAEIIGPQLILNPPGDIILGGSCDNTSQLESWLQATFPARESYETLFATASAKNSQDVINDIWSLVELRNTVVGAPTPDCAIETQILLVSAFNQGINALQLVANDNLNTDLASLVIEVNNQLAEAGQKQNALLEQMESQYRSQNQPLTNGK